MEAADGTPSDYSFAAMKSRLSTVVFQPTMKRDLLEWLDEMDEEYSTPIFASSLPYIVELALTIPANWFGLSPIFLVGPLWTGLLLAPQVSEEFNVELFIAATIFTIPLLLAWFSFIFGNTALFKKLFVGKEAILLFPFVSIGTCYWLIDNPVLFSMSVYPLWLWMSSLMLVMVGKEKAGRPRPCTKIKFSRYIDNKSFPDMSRIFSKMAPNASMPSGDAAGATAFALAVALGGKIELGIVIIFLASVGRVYYLVHHILDTFAGILVTVVVHLVSTDLLGHSLTKLQWYHPLAIYCVFIIKFFVHTWKWHKKE